MSTEAGQGHIGEPVFKVGPDLDNPDFVLYEGGWTRGDILVWLESGRVPVMIAELRTLMMSAATEIRTLRAACDGVTLNSQLEPPELTAAIEDGSMVEKLVRARAQADALQEIVEVVSREFLCLDGMHRSHAIEDGMPDHDKYRYRELRYITEDNETASRRLRTRLLEDLYRLKTSTGVVRPVLYWRYAAEMRVEETTEEGLRKLKTRVAIPKADWSWVQTIEDGGPSVRI